ncbi:MAG: hypothetical protein MPEBLZ_02087 [Candidatus Methanoperedens nitroreducens]|uniref:Uncharacterized protein n=1 Tax=Candidatus Methanoperedens nitratireducens TaxID=1392998 RepID=A0A0P8A9Q9_9EURY|nr:MAG: hypothetical protein MPEBLZ_02087 [Candidatus Methanoperedens sp. BLZ1]
MIAIVFGLGLLNLINNNNLSEFDAHIWSAYFLGIFSFVALVPYILNIIELLKPSTLIEKLAKRITVENILSAFKDVKNFKERQYYPVVDMEKDSIQPIIDIVRSSMISYDYETVRYGLKTIGNSTKCMLNDEFLDEKSESEISKHIFHNFTTIGKIAADKK